MNKCGFDLAKCLKVGDVFYECEYGINLKFVVNSEPTRVLDRYLGKDRLHVSWTSIGNSGKIISHSVTEGLDQYGPRIYDKPQYASMNNGNLEFRID